MYCNLNLSLQFFEGREYGEGSSSSNTNFEDEIKNGKEWYEKHPIELMGELDDEEGELKPIIKLIDSDDDFYFDFITISQKGFKLEYVIKS
ncbi:hypothetical protein LSPH24S_01060 [Lysinibacillus sphaericus]